MKQHSITPPLHHSNLEEMIASWGQAKLMKDLDGNCRLVDGSEEDRAEAQEWIDKFITRMEAGRAFRSLP